MVCSTGTVLIALIHRRESDTARQGGQAGDDAASKAGIAEPAVFSETAARFG
jgi:hypothetical protein